MLLCYSRAMRRYHHNMSKPGLLAGLARGYGAAHQKIIIDNFLARHSTRKGTSMDDVVIVKVYADHTVRPAHPDVGLWEVGLGTYSFDEHGEFNYAVMDRKQAEYLGLIYH